MKPNLTDAPIAVDRLATADEIRAALFPTRGPIEECSEETVYEIPADTGGYVSISGLEIETSILVQEWTKEEEDGLAN